MKCLSLFPGHHIGGLESFLLEGAMMHNPLDTIKSLIDMPERLLSLLLMVIISWQSYTQYQVNQVVMTQLRELDKSKAEVRAELASINASLNIIVGEVKESSRDRKEMLSRIYRLESMVGVDHEVKRGQIR